MYIPKHQSFLHSINNLKENQLNNHYIIYTPIDFRCLSMVVKAGS